MSKRKALRVSNCWVSSLSNQTSKMEFLLNVAIWALLLVHVDSVVGKDLSSGGHINNQNVTLSLAYEPSSSSSSSPSSSSSLENGGSGPIPGTEYPITVDTPVLHGNQGNPNPTTLNVAMPTVLDRSTPIPPKGKEKNTGNENEPPEAPAETTSHHLSSTTATTTPPNAEHLNPSQTLSSTHTPSSPTIVSNQPNPSPNTTTIPAPAPSHSTEHVVLTSSTSGGSIPNTKPTEDVASTQQHREPSSAHPDIATKTSRAGPLAPTTTPPSSSSTQAKARADTPSQLSVGGAATVVHESAAVDPLLAGLVSAFIITAVIITLLLFLKLRRRDNRPEFRRLQDLPMDDMMEDTPLSMYSY
ncbi:unnamed protein product [Lota lota]